MFLFESEENDNNEHQMPADDGTDESCINPMMTPKPVRALICGEKGNSSIVKYKITATPGSVIVTTTLPLVTN